MNFQHKGQTPNASHVQDAYNVNLPLEIVSSAHLDKNQTAKPARLVHRTPTLHKEPNHVLHVHVRNANRQQAIV